MNRYHGNIQQVEIKRIWSAACRRLVTAFIIPILSFNICNTGRGLISFRFFLGNNSSALETSAVIQVTTFPHFLFE